MFLEGLPVHHALATCGYTFLGCWARYSLCLTAPFGPLGPLCGTARHNRPVCTIWATGLCDVVTSVVFVLTFLVVTSLFTR